MRTFIWLVGIALVVLVVVAVLHKQKPADAVIQGTESQASENPTPQPQSAVSTKKTMDIKTTTQGTGEGIKTGQTAVVQYEGKLADGSVFDSTAKHGGTPFEFTLGENRVIQGWEQGILGMKVGETRLLTIPPDLGYGAGGYPPVIPANATLTFTVTLVGIK
jgi:peptidylprolyl isomerase